MPSPPRSPLVRPARGRGAPPSPRRSPGAAPTASDRRTPRGVWRWPRQAAALVTGLALALATGCAGPAAPPPAHDWLIDPVREPARVVASADGRTLHLENGLLRRSFRLAPAAATVALDDLRTGASLLRAPRPEAWLKVDGRDLPVGGLTGQPDLAYLRPEWLEALVPWEGALRLTGWREGPVQAPFAWKRTRHAEDRPWPPPGRRLVLTFASDDPDRPVEVDVVHELYDGLPVLGKWLEVRNVGPRTLRLERFTSEQLAVVEADSQVDAPGTWVMPPISVRSDYAFGGMGGDALARVAHWEPDPDYLTQVHYRRQTPVLLSVRPELGPDQELGPGDALTSFRSFLLVHDDEDRERRGLTERRFWRTLAPWVTENPLMMHVRSADPDAVRRAIDQCAEVGFEMVILTFGSGFDIEDESEANLARWRELAAYAHERGLQLGGYSLLASRRISDEHDVIDRETGETGHARFGNSPCLESAWGQDYFRKLQAFYEATGFDLLEHDGNYPGDTCASTSHPGHRGWDDSQWTQWRRISGFYAWCRERGISLNVPDCYMLAGSNKTGMGYRETNWSLPRDEQLLHGRQNIYDGTWTKPPTMGWMFVPLTEYHGGGAAATLEPLSEHLEAYEGHLAYNLASGVQACWRGPRLYDGPATRELVTRWVDWFKRYRDILESDVVHLRRADGRDLDGLLHVNPGLERRGMLVLFNPTDDDITRELDVPLYYTGLTEVALLTGWDGGRQRLALADDRRVRARVTVPAGGMAWYLVEDGR